MKSVFKFLGILVIVAFLFSCKNDDDNSAGTRVYDLSMYNSVENTISVYINSDNEGSNAGYVLRGNILRDHEEYIGSFKVGVEYRLRITIYPEPVENFVYETTFKFNSIDNQLIDYSGQ